MTAIAALPTDPAALAQAELLVFHNWDTTRYRVTAADLAARPIAASEISVE